MRAPDRRRPARRTAGSPLLRRGPVAPRARGTSTDGLSRLAEATPSFLRPRRGDSVLSAASPRRLRVRDHVRMPRAPSVAQPVTDRETVIRTESLTKVYPGGIKAVDGLDLAVH